MKEKVASVSALAVQLAQDRNFRDRLLSAIEHGLAAGRRSRRGLGLRGTVAVLATDAALLKELRGARNDLEQAYGLLEAKRRTHKLRNFLMLAVLASVVGVPQLRVRLSAAFAKASSKVLQRPPQDGGIDTRSFPEDSRKRPRRLEALTKEELYARAQEADIPGRSEMTKDQLLEALRARN